MVQSEKERNIVETKLLQNQTQKEIYTEKMSIPCPKAHNLQTFASKQVH